MAATVGDDMALRMYGILTDWTRDQALGLGSSVTRYLYYSEFIPENDKWPGDQFVKCVQTGNDLGERMTNAFKDVFAKGHQSVIIIGSDCPGITTTYLRQAFKTLAGHDVVIGPALDGGYTLIGTRSKKSDLFQNIVWSTESVYADTLAKINQQNLSFGELDALSDVDHLEDWQSYGWPLPTTIG